MDIRKLQRTIVDALEDVKAQDIAVFNTEAMSPLFERIVIASGTSNRQTKALAASVREAVRAGGDIPVRVEGEDNGEWIIVDCGSAVCHIMQPNIRDYYRLEEIWGGKPVRMKLGSQTRLPKASEPEPARPARKTLVKAAVRQTVVKPASAKPASAQPSPAGKKPAAKKPAAPKAVDRPTAAKKVAPKKAAAKPRAVQKVVVHSPKAIKPAKPAAKKKPARA